MKKFNEKKIREEIRKKLEEEFQKKQSENQSKGNFTREELLLRKKIRQEEEEKFYKAKGLVKYINRYGEVEWLTPEEEQKRYARRKKRKHSWKKKWKALKGKILELSFLFFLLFVVYFIYKNFKSGAKKTSPQQTLVITSSVSGAYIFIDGIFQNAYTPHTFRQLRPGKHIVQVYKPGFLTTPSLINISLEQRSSKKIYFQLFPYLPMYPVPIPSLPPRTMIYVDGIPSTTLSNEKLILPGGIHLLHFENDQFWIHPSNVWIRAGENPVHLPTLKISTKSDLAYIQFSSSIPEVFILLNDKPWGIRPNHEIYTVSSGTYKIDAFHPTLRFQPEQFIVQLKKGEKKIITLTPIQDSKIISCSFSIPKEYTLLIDGFLILEETNSNIHLIEGDHFLTILSKDLRSEYSQRIYVGGNTKNYFIWDSLNLKCIKKTKEEH